MALNKYQTQTATIASGQTTSGVIDIGGYDHIGLIWPAAFTGATISFTVCDTATGSFVALAKNDNTAYTLTAAAGKAQTLGAETGIDLRAFRYLKIVSAGAEAAARTFTIVLRDQSS